MSRRNPSLRPGTFPFRGCVPSTRDIAMKWFQNLTIARKLALAFSITTVMTLALGAFALLRLGAGNSQLVELSEDWMPSVQHLGEMRSQLGEYRTYEISQLYSQDDPAKIADYDKR